MANKMLKNILMALSLSIGFAGASYAGDKDMTAQKVINKDRKTISFSKVESDNHFLSGNYIVGKENEAKITGVMYNSNRKTMLKYVSEFVNGKWETQMISNCVAMKDPDCKDVFVFDGETVTDKLSGQEIFQRILDSSQFEMTSTFFNKSKAQGSYDVSKITKTPNMEVVEFLTKTSDGKKLQKEFLENGVDLVKFFSAS